MERKYTEEQIMNALEACADGRLKCGQVMSENILNLINEQKSEIVRLRKGFDAQSNGIKYLSETRDKLEAENKSIRFKTIKEFAERLKEYKIKPEYPWDDFYVTENMIDSLVNEMTRTKDCRDCKYFVGCECFSGITCRDFTEVEKE